MNKLQGACLNKLQGCLFAHAAGLPICARSRAAYLCGGSTCFSLRAARSAFPAPGVGIDHTQRRRAPALPVFPANFAAGSYGEQELVGGRERETRKGAHAETAAALHDVRHGAGLLCPCLLTRMWRLPNLFPLLAGLNIFNSRLVLATPDQATDNDFARIEGQCSECYSGRAGRVGGAGGRGQPGLRQDSAAGWFGGCTGQGGWSVLCRLTHNTTFAMAVCHTNPPPPACLPAGVVGHEVRG